MANPRPVVTCPKCGAPMNCHAERVLEYREAGSSDAADAFDGVVEEVHTCPRCSAIATRERRGII